MIGYKIAAYTGHKSPECIPVLVTLKIPKDAITNIHRKDIIDPIHAKYRCNRAIVLSIEDENGNSYKTAKSCIYQKKQLKYTLGKTIICREYVKNPCVTQGEGIHFFLDKQTAVMYGIQDDPEVSGYTGEYITWHDNGQIEVQTTFYDGTVHGNYLEWYDNGQLRIQTSFRYGKLHGEYTEWGYYGQLRIKTRYRFDKEINLHSRSPCVVM